MLVQITATSGNVEYQSGAISPQANPSDVSPSALTGFFGTNGAYTLSSGNTGTITQTYTPYFDANQNDAYDAGIDCLGDPITLQYTITRLTASASVTTPVACFGGTGVLTVVAAGGTGPLTYSRDGSNFQSNPAFTLTEGTYTFTVKDANGCIGTTIPILLGQPPVLALGAASTTNPTCNGASDGSISQPASGGTGLLTYTLSPGGTTNNTGTFTGLGAGEYTVSVSDANACSVTSSTLTLTDPAVPTLGFTAASAGGSSSASSVNGAASVSVAICTGSGSLTLSGLSRSGNRVGTLVVVAASSGNVLFQGNPFAANPTPAVVIPSAMPAFFSTSYAPYTLSSGFQGTVEQVYTPFFDVNENDQYDPGVDCLGSPITLNYTINATPVLSVTNPAAVCSPGTVNLTAAAITAGSALPPGTTLAYFTDAGASNALASPNAVVNSGTYYIRATSPAGCLDINPVVVTINPLPTPSITGLASAYCKDAPAVTLTGLGSPSGGTFRIDGGATTTVLNPANLAAGPHTVVYSVTNANNCTNTASQTVTINALPTPTITGLAGSYCQNASPVALAALGTPSGGAFTISGNASPFTQLTPSTLTPGTTYTVTYTYTNPSTTCTGTTTQTVTITPATITSPATVTGTPVCAGQSVTFTFNVNCPTNASFTAELSDAAGNFPGANLGSVTPGASNVLSIPGTTPTGTGYKIRVLGTNPSLSSVSGTFTVTAGVFNGAPVLAANQTICANQTITFSFAIGACPFPPGNVFTAQLSDAAGNFGGSPTSLGTVTPGSNTVQIPYTVPTGTTYRIRVVSSLPVATSPSSPVTFKVTSLAFSSNPTTNQTPVCAGQNFTVSFTTTNCPYLPGNVFTAELSDAAGNFGSPVSLGTVTPGINTPVTIPQNTSASSNYRVRIVSTLPAQTSAVSAFFQVRVPAFSGLPTVSLAPVCRGQAVRVSFGISCVYFGDNTFTAQLSDATGGFGSPVNLGTVVPAANNLVTIPVATAVGTGYKIRIVSSNPVVTSTASTSFQVKSCTNTREAAPDPEYPGLQVRVSPNPAPEGKLRISVSGAEGQRVGLELFNSQGQRVRQQLIERAGEVDFLDWDLARQPGGLYLLRVSGKQEARTVKVMH